MTSAIIDSNLLVYAHDRSEPEKQKKCRSLLQDFADQDNIYLTAQVLAEFFRVVTTRIPEPLTPEVAKAQVEQAILLWSVFPITSAIVIEATRGVMAHQLNYWDAQIWATARLNQIPTVLSEDFQHGRTIESVQFVNPL